MTKANTSNDAKGFVAIIDDDVEILEAITMLLEFEGYACQCFPSADAFIKAETAIGGVKDVPFCILSDVMMPGIDGLELQQHLNGAGEFQIILMSGAAGPRDVAQAFRSGAVDFLYKPFDNAELLRVVEKAHETWRYSHERAQREGHIHSRLKTLTKRELEVAKLVSQGDTNQAVAEKLQIVLRTVKVHRQRAMEKLGCRRVVDLARMLDEALHNAEIFSLRKEAKNWENAALSDPLTGVLNRRGLDHFAPSLLAMQTAMSVAVLDIDFFKKVNDSFGHLTGDKVLIAVAKRISDQSRAEDLVVRLGGEEFMLVMPRTQPSDSLQICERVRQGVQATNWKVIHPDLNLSISIGVVHRTTESSLNALMDLADKALYRAKKEGRNRVCVH